MYEEMKKWFFKNKILSIGIGMILFILLMIKILPSSTDNSLNKIIDTTAQAKTDLSHNKSIGGDSIGNIGKDYTRVNTAGGEYTGRDKTVNNNYYSDKSDNHDNTVDIVYKEINITGKVVLKSNPKKGIEGIIVKLPYYSIQSEPTDAEGNFVIYKKKNIYSETGQLVISKTSEYKASVVNDIDLQIQKIRLKLEKK